MGLSADAGQVAAMEVFLDALSEAAPLDNAGAAANTQHRAQHLCTMKTEGVRRLRLSLDHRLGKDSDE